MVLGHKIARRSVLLGSGVALLTPSLLLSRAVEGYRDIAPPRLRVGSIIKDDPSRQSIALLQRHCNTFTSENGLKTTALTKGVDRSGGRLNTSKVDLALELARDMPGMRHHAHAFFWPDHPLPVSFLSDIDGFATRFAQIIAGAVSCDVLNEVLKKTGNYSVSGQVDRLAALRGRGFDPEDLDRPERRATALGFLLRDDIPGENSTEKLRFLAEMVIALRTALANVASDDTQLVINEDELAWGIAASDLKRKAVVALADELATMTTRRGGTNAVSAKVDVIGMQGHLIGTETLHPNPDELGGWARDLGTRGYKLHISELDVKYADWDSGGAYTEESHKELVRLFLEPILPYPHVERLSFWGLRDDQHFMRKEAGNPRRDPRFFNERAQPTLYRADGTAKPAAIEVARILRTLGN